MAVASRSIQSSGFSFKSLVLAIIAVIVVLALFFIPEIIQLQRSISGTTKVVSALKTFKTATAKAPSDQNESQLSRIASLIDSGYLERISSGQAEPENKTESKATTAADGDKNIKQVAVAVPAVAESSPDQITWKAIKSKNSKTAIKKAQGQISKILQTIPTYNSASRFALANFINGLERLQDANTEKTLSAKDAQKLIEKLYSASLNALVSDTVDQLTYKRFSGIDFGPALRQGSALLSGQATTFNPQLTITGVSVAKRGRAVDSPIMVSFEGFIVGDDVVQIEMISDGVRFDDIVPKKVDPSGYRNFKVKRFELSGKVLLKVVDRNGRVFQKLYSFYPRAKIFEVKSGKFTIPKASSEYDARLDRFFTMQVSAPTGASDSFLESNGFEKF